MLKILPVILFLYSQKMCLLFFGEVLNYSQIILKKLVFPVVVLS